MPGLLRGVARTAVVAGTATAVSGRVQRRQDERYAQRDADLYAQQAQYVQQQTAPPPPADDPIQKLRELGELHAQGVLTDEEFAVQKARILNG